MQKFRKSVAKQLHNLQFKHNREQNPLIKRDLFHAVNIAKYLFDEQLALAA